MTAFAYHTEIPLSSAPRLRKVVPEFASLVMPAYVGDFTGIFGYVVGLHARGTYDQAKVLYGNGLTLYLVHDLANEHDENAVACYLAGTGDILGYVDRETAALVAPELDAGAKMEAKIVSRPQGGKQAKGGMAEIEIKLRAE